MDTCSTFTASANTWTLSVAEFEVVHLNDQKFFNLIPSRFPTIRVFDRIDPARHDEIAELETLTNPREKEKAILLNGAAVVDANNPLVQNWNHAPFAYVNPEGTRFFGPEYPSLELSDDQQTALLLAISRRERFLSRTNEAPINLEMRELCRRVTGKFADLRRYGTAIGEEDRIRLGQKVVEAKLDGLLFHPFERPSATCIAALHQKGFSKVDQGSHFKFLWDGLRIGKLYSFNDGKEFLPEALAVDEYILAA